VLIFEAIKCDDRPITCAGFITLEALNCAMKRNVSIGVFLAVVMLSSTVLASFTVQQTFQQYGKADNFDDTNSLNEWSRNDVNYQPEAHFTNMFTTQPSPDGTQVDTYVFSSRTYRMPGGEIGLLDQDMGIVNGYYGNTNPSQSLQQIKIQPSSSQAKIESEFTYYTPKAGEIDRYGGNYNMTFLGFSDEKFLPADLLENPHSFTHTMAVGETQYCDDDNNPCMYQSNHITLPLCEANNCTNADHDTRLRLANGDYSPGMTGWQVVSNITNQALTYEIESEALTNGDSDFYVRLAGEDDWTMLQNGDARASNFIEFMIAPNESVYSNAYSKPHSIRGELPTPMLYNMTYDKEIQAENWEHSVYFTENRAYLSFNATHNPAYYQRINEEVNISTNITADYIIWDPEVVYVDEDNVWSNDAKASDMSWKQGVDRDGGHIYGYAAPSAIELNGQNTLPITYDNLVLGKKTSGSIATDGGYWWASGYATPKHGSWDNFETGDGWCGESNSYGHAGCSVQGFSSNWAGDHWNTDDTTALPLIDSTYDFDGTVVAFTMDKNSWISQGFDGFEELHVEVGLQSMGYANSLSSSGGWSNGLGSWFNANGGWYENCFNGFIDLYAVPENDYDSMYGTAQYSFPWYPGQNEDTYGWVSTDPSDTSEINWGIRPDNDWRTPEYWYREIGPSNNGPKVYMTEYSDEGYTDGPRQGGAEHTYDLRDNSYWANMYNHELGSTNTGVQMKVNNWQAHRLPDGYKILNDDHLEDGGGAYAGDRAPGYDSIMNRGEGLYQSSFNHVADYWDINFYSDSEFPFGPTGFYDASVGTVQPDGSTGPSSNLAYYHLETVELGTAQTDFCYDPVSTTGQTRTNNMVGVESNSKVLLEHDSVEGQTYLNIDIGADYYDNVLARSTMMSTTELIEAGWLDDANDDTVEGYFFIDIRSRTAWNTNTQTKSGDDFRTEDDWLTSTATGLNSGGNSNWQPFNSVPQSQTPNMAVCWGDWGSSTDRMDTEDGHWWDYETEQFLPSNSNNGWVQDDTFCLDKYGAAGEARKNIDWQDFIDTTTCVSDEPVASQVGQNPDKAFWCGLNLMSPENDDVEPIRIIAQSAPYIAAIDLDPDGDGIPGDGVAGGQDQCPNTNTNQDVDEDGCPTTETPSDENLEDDQDELAPYGGQNDYDSDGIVDLFDKCDTKSGVGYAPDYANYTTQDHIQYIVNRWAPGSRIYVTSFNSVGYENWRPGCPIERPYEPQQDDDDGDPGQPGPPEFVPPWNPPEYSPCQNGEEDLGIYTWEDEDYDSFDPDGDGYPTGQERREGTDENDANSKPSGSADAATDWIDEDWNDLKDNDGDGLIDEDGFDDCDGDDWELWTDPTFDGRVEAMYSVKDQDGRYIPKGNSQIIAEQDNQINDEWNVYDTSWEEFSIRTDMRSEPLLFHQDVLSQQSTQVQCNAIMKHGSQARMNMQLFVWMPWTEIDRIVDSNIGIEQSDLNLGFFGRNQITNYTDPGGSGERGAYVPYGQATGFHTTMMPLPVGTGNQNYSGSALTGEGQRYLASQTGWLGLDENPLMFVNFAEGHYRMKCIAEEIKSIPNSSQTYVANQIVIQDFTAVALCVDGDLPNPPNLNGDCVRTNGGGSITTSETVNALLDNVIILGIAIILLALSVLLWFIEWRIAAIGLGLATISYSLSLGDEGQLFGTLLHVGLLAGFTLVVAEIGSKLGGFGLAGALYSFAGAGWFLMHTLVLFDIIETNDFIINAYPFVALILSLIFLAITVAGALVVFELDDEPWVPEMVDLDTISGGGLLAKGIIANLRNERG